MNKENGNKYNFPARMSLAGGGTKGRFDRVTWEGDKESKLADSRKPFVEFVSEQVWRQGEGFQSDPAFYERCGSRNNRSRSLAMEAFLAEGGKLEDVQ